MAKANDNTEKKGGGISVLAVLLLSLIAAGGGVGFGFMTPDLVKTESKSETEVDAVPEDKELLPSATLTPFGPITTNIAQPSNVWIRIEGTLIADKSLGADAPIVAKRVSGDILSYLRTLTIAQLAGPSSFQHLREDLNDRARIRSEGKVSELVVTSLIIE